MNYSEAYNTTIAEFSVYQKAFEIRMIDDIFLKAQGAWLGQAVQATKGKGRNIRSKFSDFRDFYDWEKEIKNIFVPENRNVKKRRSLAEINAIANEYINKRKGGK